jgi:hypothetical protein
VPAQQVLGAEFKSQYSKKKKTNMPKKPEKQNQNNLLGRLV